MASRTITGTLIVPNRGPMARARLDFLSLRSTPAGLVSGSRSFTTTDANGQYTITLETGTYKVSVMSDTVDSTLSSNLEIVEGANVDIMTLIEATNADVDTLNELLTQVLDAADGVGAGVPAGGTTGQHLVKTSDTDYATQWSDPPTGDGGSPDLQVVSQEDVDHYYAITDEDGYKALWIDKSGRAGFVPAPNILDEYLQDRDGNLSTAPIVADVNHILVSGQSLAVGIYSTPGLTTTQPHQNLMGNVGVIDGAVDGQGITSGSVSTSLVPLVYTEQNSSIGESIGVAGANYVRELVAENYQLAVSNNARGATRIAGLSKTGGDIYGYGLTQVSAFRQLANSELKTHALQAIWWMQGESDSTDNTPRATYKAALKQLVDDVNTDIDQAHPARLMTYQMASHTKRGTGRPPEIGLAQLEASREHDHIFLVTPMYHVPYNADGVHLPNHSQRWVSQYFAKVYKRVCIDGKLWRPLEPLSVIRQGRIIDISFHVPVGELVLDTARVVDPGDYGFEVLLDSNSSIQTIGSVAITSRSTMRIVLAADPGEAVRVRYAYGSDGDQTGPISGARGCLRDDDRSISMYNDASGDPYELFNWCVIFNELAGEI